MTKIGEEVIFSSECLTRFFRLPITHDGARFIVNTGRNSVSSIQSSDQKLQQTWTVTHPHSFTSPVTCSTTDNILSCVMDKNVIVTWPSSAEDLSTSDKVKLKQAVFAILPIEDGSIVIVFCNGHVCLMQDVHKLPKKANIIGESEELVFTDAVMCLEGVIVATLIQHKKTQQYRLVSYLLKIGKKKFQHVFTQPVTQSDVSLKSWCLFPDSQTTSLLTLWSDGKIHKLSLLDGKSVFLLAISGNYNEASVAIDVVGHDHLAVAKTSTIAGKRESLLEVWDLNYCVQKAGKILKHSLTKSVQVKAFDTSVFLSSREGIIKLPVKIEASTLASALGKAVIADADRGKNFVWTPNGKLRPKGKSILEDQKSLLHTFEDHTSEKLQETMENLSADELEKLCNELASRKDITEEEIVKILKVLIRMKPAKMNGTSGEGNSNECTRNKLLNAVFQISFSDIFLIRQLKRLDIEETVMVLKFLHGILESQLFASKQNQQPSDLQIINWIELLTQSHYDELVTSKDNSILMLLKKLQLSLCEKMEVYTELEEVECLLSVLRKKCPLPERSKTERYCIENPFL